MFVVFCVGIGLCDELITRLEEPYRVRCVCLIMCDLEASKVRWPRPQLVSCATAQIWTINTLAYLALYVCCVLVFYHILERVSMYIMCVLQRGKFLLVFFPLKLKGN